MPYLVTRLVVMLPTYLADLWRSEEPLTNVKHGLFISGRCEKALLGEATTVLIFSRIARCPRAAEKIYKY